MDSVYLDARDPERRGTVAKPSALPPALRKGANGCRGNCPRTSLRHELNPELDPLLTVFSTLGLVMLHMATVSFWAETFHRKPLSRQALRRHITGLLLDGLQLGGHRVARKHGGRKK